jgi:hypothetical protein
MILLMAIGAISPGRVGARPEAQVAALCDSAAVQASRRHGVPLDVMGAVTRAETGRNRDGTLLPWPWTVNMEGAGRWFGTRQEAQAFATQQFSAGARSFDVGCFQINYKWHSAAFSSLEEMFDPVTNADYAARFLAELFAEFGDWTAAAGAFHSRSPEFAQLYEARFSAIRQGLAESEFGDGLRSGAIFGAPVALDLEGSLASGPFLGSGHARLGSLVPIQGRHRAGRLSFFE